MNYKKYIRNFICNYIYNENSDPYKVVNTILLRRSYKDYILRNIINKNQKKIITTKNKYFNLTIFLINLLEYLVPVYTSLPT